MTELSGSHLPGSRFEGIDTVFTVYAGPMTDALGALSKEGVRIIGCRHEEQAGFMAQAWGYATKKPGVVIVGSGPAASNTVTCLYVATESGFPLVVLGGSAGGTRVQLDRPAASAAFRKRIRSRWPRPHANGPWRSIQV